MLKSFISFIVSNQFNLKSSPSNFLLFPSIANGTQKVPYFIYTGKKTFRLQYYTFFKKWTELTYPDFGVNEVRELVGHTSTFFEHYFEVTINITRGLWVWKIFDHFQLFLATIGVEGGWEALGFNFQDVDVRPTWNRDWWIILQLTSIYTFFFIRNLGLGLALQFLKCNTF